MERERPAPRSIVVDVTTSFHLDRLEKVTDRWRTKAAESARPAGSLDLLGFDSVNQAYAHLAAPVYARPAAAAAEPAPSLRALKRAQSSAAEPRAPPAPSAPSSGGASGGALFAGLKLAAGVRGGGSGELEPPACAAGVLPTPSDGAPALFAGLSVLSAPLSAPPAAAASTEPPPPPPPLPAPLAEVGSAAGGSTRAGAVAAMAAADLFSGLELLAEPSARAPAAGADAPAGARRVEAILAAYVQKSGATAQPRASGGHEAILAAFVTPADGAARRAPAACGGAAPTAASGGGGGGRAGAAADLLTGGGCAGGVAAAIARAAVARGGRDSAGDGDGDGPLEATAARERRASDGGVTEGGLAATMAAAAATASLFAGLQLTAATPEPPRHAAPPPWPVGGAGDGNAGGGTGDGGAGDGTGDGTSDGAGDGGAECVGCPSLASVPLFAGLHVAAAEAAEAAGGTAAQPLPRALELPRAPPARGPGPSADDARAARPAAACASLFAGLQTAPAGPPLPAALFAAPPAPAAAAPLRGGRPSRGARLAAARAPSALRAGLGLAADADDDEAASGAHSAHRTRLDGTPSVVARAVAAAPSSLPLSSSPSSARAAACENGCAAAAACAESAACAASCEEILGVAEVGLGFLDAAAGTALEDAARAADGLPPALGALALGLGARAPDDDGAPDNDDADAPTGARGVDWRPHAAAAEAPLGAPHGAHDDDAPLAADPSAALGAAYAQRQSELCRREAHADALGARVRDASAPRRACAAELARARAAAAAARAAHAACGARKREAVAARRFKDAASEAAAERDAADARARADDEERVAEAAHAAADARVRALETEQASLLEQIARLRHV